MEKSNVIYKKLESFITKFYINELIRGIVFFVGLGLLYFLFTLFIEYFLWLSPNYRSFLFWIFILVECFLFFRFILFPVFKLFKIQKGIDYKAASGIIGNHFLDVQDQLLNFLQLSNSSSNTLSSELLEASIEQKANKLQPIPFSNAIDFSANKKYLPLALLPILFLFVLFISGNKDIFSQSLNRVVHYNQAFMPPAPFEFVVLNSNLQTQQNVDFTLQLKTVGKIIPDNVTIHIGNESYFLEKISEGIFKYTFSKPTANFVFHLEANSISSNDYQLQVMAVPSILNFEMLLNFPSYLNRKSEVIKGTGNAIIPEGTVVNWKLATQATQTITFSALNAVVPFQSFENNFKLSRMITQSTDYQIITSNNKIKNYEKLAYQFNVVKDQYPNINVGSAPDSLKIKSTYLIGQISDDIGLHKLQIVYYDHDKPQIVQRGTIPLKSNLVDRFVFSFPANLPIKEGVQYDYYFEVFDNDVLHQYKSSKSTVFSTRIATQDEKANQLLQQQNDNINGLQKSLKDQNKQFSDIDKIQKLGKEKNTFEFKEQQNVTNFINQQKKKNEEIKDITNKMKEDLEKSKSKNKDALKEDLIKRLENANKETEKNKKLLDELNDLNNKIKKEDLLENLDKFKQNSKNQTKSLEQLVELTKKFYVEQKAEELMDQLNKLADKQEKLSENQKENSLAKQNEITKDFEKFKDELDALEKKNKELKAPVDLPKEEGTQKSIDEDLKNASEDLKNGANAKAAPKQKSAANKMKSMSSKMAKSLESGEKEQLEEDVKMLRQILDNLLSFSHSQEDLMAQFKATKSVSPSYNKNIKLQQNLKLQFKHIDDSLFTLSLRNPKLAENVTKEIGNVQYNIDQSLDKFTDSNIQRGVSNQQYAISSTNVLGDFLSDMLSSMQMSLSGKGPGKPKLGKNPGDDMQLSDIIKKQEGLAKKVKDGMKPGNEQGKGSEGQKGDAGKTGESGKSGDKGKTGKSGSKEGENGQEGEADAKSILEIYQEQMRLRESLDKELAKQGLGKNGKNISEQMKDIEKSLLNEGLNSRVLQQILNVKQQLLKLDTAFQEQNQDTKRESEKAKKDFINNSNALPSGLIDYLNSIEILNRQSLPLRSNFDTKVKEYFNKK
ncbi:MAG: hypothetical protein QG594_1830 [Bacteroidota bacterium]|nr:hypothetical protein [Bacteroidota bacterium]